MSPMFAPVVQLFGLALVVAGVALWSVPAALVVAGVELVVVGVSLDVAGGEVADAG